MRVRSVLASCAALAALAGCGGESRSSTSEAAPGRNCEREIATFHDGTRPAKRPIVVPPRPGLRAVAVTEHTTRLEWSFERLPAACRPVHVLLGVRSTADPPTSKLVPVHGLAGSADIVYHEFLPAPVVAMASAFAADGRRSGTVSVSIERSAEVAPDPAPPLAPVTAPAARPVACSGRPTVVSDPGGDLLVYELGKPPARVARMTPELSAIDVTRAAVRIEGRRMCASFTLAGLPADVDFDLTLVLRDTAARSCCAALQFRRTAGRLELGYRTSDALRPVEDGGAALRGRTLVLSGTLPPPAQWDMVTRRMPAPDNLAWSVVTSHTPERYGPTYHDWLPRHGKYLEPFVRHRDGATVPPPRSR